MVVGRFGHSRSFVQKVNPDTQVFFGEHVEVAVMGDFPTLTEIDAAYGTSFAAQWLLPHIANLTMYTGANNMNAAQQKELARIIAAEYRHFKITELLLFFYRFKEGRYGRFYGNVDPLVITCALRDFAAERNDLIFQYEQEKRQKELEERRKSERAITREEWEQMKQQQNQKT